MKWLLVAGAVMVGLIVITTIWGSLLPREHHAQRSARFAQSPAAVWSVIADPLAAPSWRPDVRSVEPLPAQDGRPRWKEIGSDAITFELVADEAPVRRVVRIADDALPFGGTWTYTLAGDGDGTRLTITEDGEVRNPLFRFLARYAFGHGGTMESYLLALGGRFGEEVSVS
jgi:Polyketide cyclase / dehydrase and lipid transport